MAIRPIFRAKPAGENCATESAVTAASISQPTTSLIAAELIAITPTRVLVRSSSIRMRPRMGSAVMENAVPTNSM